MDMTAKDVRRPARTYAEKLKDPRWQRRRLEILQRDDWKCTSCGDGTRTLHVHHHWYEGEPWDAPSAALTTLCEDCHAEETEWRQESEECLLRLLRAHLNICRLDRLTDLLWRMGPDITKALTDADAGAFGRVEEWLRNEREANTPERATALLSELDERGFTLRAIPNGSIGVTPAGVLDEELLRRICALRGALHRVLVERSAEQATV